MLDASPAHEHALSLLQALADRRRRVRAVVLDGPSVTTLGTREAPSIIERAEPETRAGNRVSALARLAVHYEDCAKTWADRDRCDLARVFDRKARDVRASLTAVIASEGNTWL